MTYERYCGLVLNLPRVRFQRAAEVAYGLGAVSAAAELPPVWFDAIAWDESQVEDLEWASNAPRLEAAALAELAKRGM